MTVLDSKGAAMKAFLLLVLALGSSALPLLPPAADMDVWLLAEVRLRPETFQYLFLYMAV